MKKFFAGLLALSIVIFAGCSASDVPTPTPSSTQASVTTSTPKKTSSPKLTVSPSSTASAPAAVQQPTRSSKPAATLDTTSKPTSTPTPTPTPTKTPAPPSDDVSEPAVATQNERTVYITKTGEKYHRSGCKYLRKSQISISLDDAIARGFEPCSVCNP